MIVPNASITSYASKTGERGDGLPALQAIAVPLPIPCRLDEPTDRQRRTLRDESIDASRVLTVAVDGLAAASIEPKVGDRPGITIDSPGAAEQLYTIMDAVNIDPTSAMGWLRPLRLFLAEAEDDAPIAAAGGGK